MSADRVKQITESTRERLGTLGLLSLSVLAALGMVVVGKNHTQSEEELQQQAAHKDGFTMVGKATESYIKGTDIMDLQIGACTLKGVTVEITRDEHNTITDFSNYSLSYGRIVSKNLPLTPVDPDIDPIALQTVGNAETFQKQFAHVNCK